MPLTDDNLSIWKISFRWAGLNPDAFKYRFYIPHESKDNMRLLLDSIIKNVLFCSSLKHKDLYEARSKNDQRNMDLAFEIISDQKYNRDFLHHHYISRSDFAHWCNRESIPYPEFWFPPGWAVHDLNAKDWLLYHNPELVGTFIKIENPINSEDTITHNKKSLTSSESLWSDTVGAAKTIWSQDKNLSIAEVINQIKSMKHLKAASFTHSAIRKHIAKYSPTPGKPGRKPAKKSS